MLSSNLTAHFERRQLLIDPVTLLTYEVDAGFDRGRPDGVFFPESSADVVKLVKLAATQGVALIARGAGTGLSGGAVAEQGGVVVSFARMNRVLDFHTVGRRAVVEPGVVNLKFDALAKEAGLYYPPDPSSQRSSLIGGNLGMNAGGPHCFKYGVTTNYVIGVEVVLADGSLVRCGGQAFDYPEYDLTGVLVGSEGALGLVTRIDLRLLRNPPGVKTIMASFPSDEAAGAAVSAIIAAGLAPATLEMMDQKVMRMIEDYVQCGLPVTAQTGLIVEADGYAASLDAQIEEIADILTRHGAYDLRIANSEAERQQIWYGRKSAAGAFSRLSPAFYLIDVTVPRSLLAATLAEVNQICERYQVRVGHVFHAGDGNLHPAILCDPSNAELMQRVFACSDEIVALCISKDGSITGEHGVGIEKRKYMPMMYSAAELSAMLDVKQIFDPKDMLNPGKIFPANLPTAQPFPAVMPAMFPFSPASSEEAAEGLATLSVAGRQARILGRSKAGYDAHGYAVITTENLHGVKRFAPNDLYITVGAGSLLADVHEYLHERFLQTALASPWAMATVGGIVASNLNAPQRIRYGAIRDNLLATTVALADGRVIRAGRPVVKNVAGYDLPKLLVGSFGELGLMTDITLKVMPMPRSQHTLCFALEEPLNGLATAQQIIPRLLVASGLLVVEARQLSGATDSPFALAVSLEGLPEDVAAEGAELSQALAEAGLAQMAAGETNTLRLWQDFLGKTTESELLLRVGVPPAQLDVYLRQIPHVIQGSSRWLFDVASGLAYVRFQPRDIADATTWLAALRQPALALGGYGFVLQAPAALTGQVDRRGYQPATLALMRKLKAKWDARGVLITTC
jgi:D-lactate dehydrogenase (cytochrome)